MKRSSNWSVATRLRALLLTLGLVLVGVVGVASPASAYAMTCGSYGSTPSFSCVSFSGFSGQQPWGYPVDTNGHNCTNYVSYRLWQDGVPNPGNLGNALDWDDNAVAYGLTVNGTPAAGSVAVWEAYSGPALESGHVAYVDKVTSTYIDISEDNYGGTSMKKRFYVGQSDWPDHFIHFVGEPANNGEGQLLWKLRNHKSAGAADASFYYGPDTGTPVVGDWDANGSESIGVVRDNGAGNLYWQLRYSNTGGSPSVTATYGASTDAPIVGNWDGVGTTTVGIVRDDGSGQLMWKLSNNNSTTATTFYYGASTDTPVVGDWDGNGTTTIGIVRKDAASGQLLWKLRNSNSAGTADVSFYYGALTAKPVPGDWDGNGTVTAGTVRSDDGSGQLYWQLRDSNSAGTPGYEFYYGASTDTPVAGSWGGAGAMNVGIARG